MTTQIFKTYSDFLDREDKRVNGVDEKHAAANPNYQSDNVDNEGCWNCSDCSGCSGCSDCSGCSGCSHCSGCSDCYDCSHCFRCSHCSGCSDCSDCSGCFDCSDCSHCSDCSDCPRCSGLRNAKPVSESSWFDVPTIHHIHAAVLTAASKPDALSMKDWHTCETTHCRAGWVVTLAGEKGKALEKASSTLFAAMQIYKASSPIRVSPVRFFESNDAAMADMKRCAELEAATTPATA